MVWWIWVLWAAVIALGVYGLGADLRANRPLVAVVLVLAAVLGGVLRIGVNDDRRWYGLEYEDAYVYAAAARYLTGTTRVIGTAGLTVCAVGSVDECEEWESFPGHLPGVPALFAGAQAWMTYRPSLFPIIAGLSSTLAIFFVWWAAFRIYNFPVAATVAAVLFAITPAMALYGGSACSESPSAIPIAVAVGASAASLRADTRRTWWRWQVATLLAVGLGVLCRRENAVLGICGTVVALRGRPLGVSTLQRWLAVSIWMLAGVATLLFVFPSVISERGEYGGFSFGSLRFVQTLPVLIQALATPRWFGSVAFLAGVMACNSLVRRCRRREHHLSDGMVLLAAGCVVCMCGLYASHVRSAYQLAGATTSPFDFLRYLSNTGVFLCIVAADAANAVTAVLAGLRRGWPKLLMGACIAGYIVANVTEALMLRSEFAAIERSSRLMPALAALSLVTELGRLAPPVVTLEPLVLQIYGKAELRFISLRFLRSEHITRAGGKVLYLRQERYQSPVDQLRYADGIAALPTDVVRQLRHGVGWSICSMSFR